MIIGVSKETKLKENRVALTPDVIKDIVKKGFEVRVEPGAGLNSFYSDELYVSAGAKIASRDEVFSASDVLLRVNAPEPEEVAKMKKGAVLISFMWASANSKIVDA